eukprot:TRINITY_DN9591_c0_g1_i2.p1 TRINITY_DN9591_c0_g1~~TRINITY_DN9591_c0_g1_i2.p1  ORF type:complete len:266 (+),score=62.67 TRINITY_DN9591_c0_g1_i2:104-901(+)
MGTSSSKNNSFPDKGDPLFRPKGLHGSRLKWKLVDVEKMIKTKQLAPFYPPQEEERGEVEECPICFYFYPGGLNRARCCKKAICTECYLNIKTPNSTINCPFCLRADYHAKFTGPLSKEEKQREKQESQKVLELQLKMREEEIQRDKINRESKIAKIQNSPPSTNVDIGVKQQSSSSTSQDSSLCDSAAYAVSPKSDDLDFDAFDLGLSDLENEDFLLHQAIQLSLQIHSESTESTTRETTGAINPFGSEEILVNDLDQSSRRVQ